MIDGPALTKPPKPITLSITELLIYCQCSRGTVMHILLGYRQFRGRSKHFTLDEADKINGYAIAYERSRTSKNYR